MPELPEVQTTVDGLQNKIRNRVVIDVWSDWKKSVKIPKDFDAFCSTIKNKRINRVWRRAKNVLFDLSDGYTLLVHMKMTGHLMVGRWEQEDGIWKPLQRGPLDDPMNSYIHFIFFLDNGDMVALSDLRKFAKIELWHTEELMEAIKSLGPEPLESAFTFTKFKERMEGKRGKVKQVIMDPNVIVGVGNIYASEALWWSKIHPEASVIKFTEKQLKDLYAAIKKVLKLGIDFGGDSFSDYRNVDGEKGKFTGTRKAYKREGQPCFRCKTPLKRVVVATRSSFFCPKCQVV